MNFQKFTTFKTILIALVLTINANQLFAQTTNGIFFQAVARDNYSNPAKDRKIFVQSSILQTTPTGTKVLTEEHQANTDATGVFSISLGNGVRVGGTASGLNTIDWSKGPFYLNLKVAITPIGGNSSWDYNKEWVDMGTTSFGAVPFALYSASSAKVDDKLNVSDTTTMLKVYAKAIKVQSLETSLASKLTAADTLTMLAPYAKAAYTIDSSFFKTQLATKLSISDSTIYVTPTQLAAKTFDQTPITTAIATKLNISDSTKYVTPTQLAAKTFDQTPITTAIATKLNIADSTKYITPTQLAAKTFDTTSLSNRINLKATNIDLVNLTNNLNSNTASITSNTSAINSNTASITANTNSILTNTASITANTTAINSNTASVTANSTAIGLKLDANKVGVANGVASLNLNGLIPNNQIPAISFQSATVVTGEPAMLALNNAVVGSIAIRTDNSKNFVLSALPASTIGNWIELVSPASVTSVNGNAGPTVNLAAADIPGVEALVNKSTATNLGSTNPSDILYPTQKAVKAYVDAQTAAAGVLDGSITNAKLAGTITAGKLVGTDISIVGTIATGVWSASTISLNKGGTGASNAADARTNLGLVIGTNVQAPLTAGTDYLTPTGSAASLTNFPTLNQNTTGNAATATLATNATYATTAGNITATSNTTLTSLSNLNAVGTITTGIWSATTIDIAHGGTGSTTKNFVDLSTNQNAIGGTKTFSNNIVSNGVSIGKGSGVTTSSIIIGPWTNAGENSIAIGSGTMTGNSGAYNIAIGENALRDSGPVSKNTAVGFNAGSSATVGDNNTYLGYSTIPNSGATISNSTAIGSGAKIYASNTIRLGANGLDGTTAIDSVITTGTLTAGAVTYPKTHGSANQVLSTTGSGTLTWTTVSTTADAATLSGTIAINKGGTGATTATEAFNALAPSQTSNSGKYLTTDGTNASWTSASAMNANLNDQTGTTYTLLSTDNGKVITLNNASAITLTVASGLGAGFNCMIVQKGAGIVTLVGASGVTVTNRIGFTKTAGTNAIVTLIAIASNYFVSGGDMQ
jgi:hypothetical protein